MFVHEDFHPHRAYRSLAVLNTSSQNSDWFITKNGVFLLKTMGFKYQIVSHETLSVANESIACAISWSGGRYHFIKSTMIFYLNIFARN